MQATKRTKNSADHMFFAQPSGNRTAFYTVVIGGVMTSPIRTVQIGKPFSDGGRQIIISHSRSRYTCACGMALHQIDRGDLCANYTNPRTGEHEHWHTEHLKDWKLIVVDRDGNEVA